MTEVGIPCPPRSDAERSVSRPFARVLFVAHRDEILTQAMASFRRIRPEARFGRFNGAEKDEGAERQVAPGWLRPDNRRKSAFREVHGQSAGRGFLVLQVHVDAGLPHRLDAIIEGHKMLTVTA